MLNSEIEIATFSSDLFNANCYIIINKKNQQSIVIDPSAKFEVLDSYLSENSDKVEGIILTHGHLDHISTINELLNKYPMPIYIQENDSRFLADANLNLSKYITGKSFICEAPYVVVSGDQTVNIAELSIRFIHTPGHTTGSMCILVADYLFSGDTLFQLNVGRGDFPGGSLSNELESIKMKLLPLNPDTVVYPGHGGPTTIKFESENNPYLL